MRLRRPAYEQPVHRAELASVSPSRYNGHLLMTPATPPTSMRLLRAAEAEHAQLDRHRARLLQARERLRAELANVERDLAEVDERRRLLERLAPPPCRTTGSATTDTHARSEGRPGGVHDDVRSSAPDAGAAGGLQLRGPEIRAAAVRLLLADPAGPEALHYRDWFQRLVGAGFSVAGKDPQAVFLTQLTRSPLVRKSTQAGVYQLDRNAPEQLRRRLDDLQREMRELTAPTFVTGTTDLAAIRTQRVALGKDISRVEKALEEALQLLGETGGTVVRAAAG
jgi:hypothetical protein